MTCRSHHNISCVESLVTVYSVSVLCFANTLLKVRLPLQIILQLQPLKIRKCVYLNFAGDIVTSKERIIKWGCFSLKEAGGPIASV